MSDKQTIQNIKEELSITPDARLDRIESKIDKLSDAMISLARTEEKILAIEQNNHNTHERMNKNGDKVDALERTVAGLANTIRIHNALLVVYATTLVGAAFKVFGG